MAASSTNTFKVLDICTRDSAIDEAQQAIWRVMIRLSPESGGIGGRNGLLKGDDMSSPRVLHCSLQSEHPSAASSRRYLGPLAQS